MAVAGGEMNQAAVEQPPAELLRVPAESPSEALGGHLHACPGGNPRRDRLQALAQQPVALRMGDHGNHAGTGEAGENIRGISKNQRI